MAALAGPMVRIRLSPVESLLRSARAAAAAAYDARHPSCRRVLCNASRQQSAVPSAAGPLATRCRCQCCRAHSRRRLPFGRRADALSQFSVARPRYDPDQRVDRRFVFRRGAVIRSIARVFCASLRSTIRDSRRSSRRWARARISAARPGLSTCWPLACAISCGPATSRVSTAGGQILRRWGMPLRRPLWGKRPSTNWSLKTPRACTRFRSPCRRFRQTLIPADSASRPV
jgi:hypothetical protein